jgi:hypothetical protein
MDARQKFLIASIGLFVTSLFIGLPWMLISVAVQSPNPFVLALILADASSVVGGIAFAWLGTPLLFASWGMAAAGKGGLALAMGLVAVAAALLLIIANAYAPQAASLTGTELMDYLLWLGSPVAACLAGLACVSRVSSRN